SELVVSIGCTGSARVSTAATGAGRSGAGPGRVAAYIVSTAMTNPTKTRIAALGRIAARQARFDTGPPGSTPLSTGSEIFDTSGSGTGSGFVCGAGTGDGASAIGAGDFSVSSSRTSPTCSSTE